ncbi:MAG: LPS export ABC transporter permease LptF [Pseudolabrys sp.]|nr:LPS export ABC transporter permease LptF [Pseudolabrys sp.]MBV9955622.1 LPS export ABC transporter permease LptF [Pseudolabrys sp.]
MGSLNRYIFRTAGGAFAVVLISLTAVIWITQALREIDLVTSQGQSVLVFFGITSLVIPLLVMVIAPIALVIAVAHTLHKLTNDSEIIVMNAAGISPWHLFRAMIPVALVATVLVTAIAAYFAPKGYRMLRHWIAEVRANLVNNIVQPGRFLTVESGVTIHIRARQTNGQLVGVFLDDRRNPQERNTILADVGEVMQNDRGTFLLLRNGTVHRYDSAARAPNIVTFDTYAIDLSRFAGGPLEVRYSLRERYLWELLWPDPKDNEYIDRPGRFRAEMFDRLMAPFYPVVFTVIAFAFLGAPRTTRQNRSLPIAGTIMSVLVLRLIGFASTVIGARIPLVLAVQFIAAAVFMGGGLYVIYHGIILEPPALITNWINAQTERLTRRFATS